MSFSELKTLESEVLRLEKAHGKTADAAVRNGIAAKILEHCKRISDLEKRAFISYKVRVEELIPRYQQSAAPVVPPAPPAATLPPPPAPVRPAPLPAAPPPTPVSVAPPDVSPLMPPPPATAPVVVPPAPKTSITPILAPVDVTLLAAKVEALGKQPFSPEAYPARKQQYERLIQEIAVARNSSPSEAPYLSVLAKLWAYSIGEDDAYEDYRKLNRA